VKNIKTTLFIICCLCSGLAAGTEVSINTDSSITKNQGVEQTEETESNRQERCAKAIKKARRKSLWATFLLSMVSDAGNSLSSTQKSNVTFTDQDGRKTKGTITYVDPYKRAYLNERDRQRNSEAASDIYNATLQKAGCLDP
jgi:hypothetical protein